jgi:hypothetical protein
VTVTVRGQDTVGQQLGVLVPVGVVRVRRHHRRGPRPRRCPTGLHRHAGQPTLVIVPVERLRVIRVRLGLQSCFGVEHVPDGPLGRLLLFQVALGVVRVGRGGGRLAAGGAGGDGHALLPAQVVVRVRHRLRRGARRRSRTRRVHDLVQQPGLRASGVVRAGRRVPVEVDVRDLVAGSFRQIAWSPCMAYP